MTEEKKTEEQLRQEIIEEYSLEEGDERIDKILDIKKDRYAATQAKKKAQEELESLKKPPVDPKGEEDPNKGKSEQPSLKDIRALADVPDEDVDEIMDFSKFKKISIAEAKAHPTMKILLATRAEERKSAAAANTGNSRGGASKISGEALLEQASTNQALPESDEEINALIQARMAKRKGS